MPTLRLVPRARLILAALFLISILLTTLLLASSTRAQAQASPAGSPAGAQDSASTMNREPPKESRAAADEDEQAQFKHSAAVQGVAKLTGLSLDHAYWLCVLLNFAVIAGTVIYFSKKNLPGVFRNRTASIQKAMQEARQASDEANRRLGEIETRLSRLDAEIAGMSAAAEKEAVGEEARIQAAAEEDARKIVESAEQEIAAAAKSARRELTAYAANLAVSLAARQIKVDTATDQALVREFAKELSPMDPTGAGTKSGRDGH
jgi:F-type H+-transporting ATPase subunit b